MNRNERRELGTPKPFAIETRRAFKRARTIESLPNHVCNTPTARDTPGPDTPVTHHSVGPYMWEPPTLSGQEALRPCEPLTWWPLTESGGAGSGTGRALLLDGAGARRAGDRAGAHEL